jgi:hypothetical protein
MQADGVAFWSKAGDMVRGSRSPFPVQGGPGCCAYAYLSSPTISSATYRLTKSFEPKGPAGLLHRRSWLEPLNMSLTGLARAFSDDNFAIILLVSSLPSQARDFEGLDAVSLGTSGCQTCRVRCTPQSYVFLTCMYVIVYVELGLQFEPPPTILDH